MWINEFETELDGNQAVFWEALETSAPHTARPYCCFLRHVIFYKYPYRVLADHNYDEWDRVKSCWDLVGTPWTDADISWSRCAPFVMHEGCVFELRSGRVVWREDRGGWWLKWQAWRVPNDDRRLPCALAYHTKVQTQ